MEKKIDKTWVHPESDFEQIDYVLYANAYLLASRILHKLVRVPLANLEEHVWLKAAEDIAEIIMLEEY